MTAALDVTHHADHHRYVLTDGDEAVGLLAYRPVGRPGTDLVDVYTTQISPDRAGARASARCWFGKRSTTSAGGAPP